PRSLLICLLLDMTPPRFLYLLLIYYNLSFPILHSPPPQTNLFFFTICFTILNNLPLLSSFSSVSPIFLLSRSFALPITFLLSLLASRYACLLFLTFVVSFSLPDVLPSSLLTFSISIYSLRFSWTRHHNLYKEINIF